MDVQTYAQREIGILLKDVPDALIEPFIPEILALYNKFMNSGQSGGSAPFVARAISQAVESLCLLKPLTPLTGNDDEWDDVSKISGVTYEFYQNNRNCAVFKEEGNVYYLNAIVWKSQRGSTFTGKSKEGITSHQFIKGFPFTPKTFYIDVIETEVSPDNFEFEIKDREQLREVAEYYDLQLPW